MHRLVQAEDAQLVPQDLYVIAEGTAKRCSQSHTAMQCCMTAAAVEFNCSYRLG